MSDKKYSVYGLDLEQPASLHLAEIRRELGRVRGKLSDLSHCYPRWRQELGDVDGLLTCGIVCLHGSLEEMRKEEVRHLDEEHGLSLPFYPRGIGTDSVPACFVCGKQECWMRNIAAFVDSRENGQTIVDWFSGRARLDYRAHEPSWIQVKVGTCSEHLPCLKTLQEICNKHSRIRQFDIEVARACPVKTPI